MTTLLLNLQSTRSDIRPHIKWAVSQVIAHGNFNLPQGFVWVCMGLHTHFIAPEGHIRFKIPMCCSATSVSGIYISVILCFLCLPNSDGFLLKQQILYGCLTLLNTYVTLQACVYLCICSCSCDIICVYTKFC